jgi:hypothetical protein
MTDPTPSPAVTFRLIGPDTGIARLLADLELAGADYPVIAEPEPGADDALNPRSYTGQLSGLTAEQAREVAVTYLASVTGERIWIDDNELEV